MLKNSLQPHQHGFDQYELGELDEEVLDFVAGGTYRARGTSGGFDD